MSRSLTETVEIALAPRRIAVVRRRRLGRKILQSKVLDCAPEAETAPLWQPALAALRRALADPIWQHARASVVLSNHFVRYALVARTPGVGSAAEEAALVMHRFITIFGAVAQTWSIRTSLAGDDQLVAAAVDQALLDGLADAAQAADLKLVSEQPLLMAAFNRLRDRLRGEPFWYVVAEPGKTCLAGFANGAWRLLEAYRGGADPTSDWSRLIEQAVLTNDNSIKSNIVLVDAPHLQRLEFEKPGAWQFVDAKTLQRGSDDRLDAMALALS